MDVNITDFCTDAFDILRFAGWILTIFKIAIPLLIIAFGIFDLGKAVTSGKDDDIKKAAKTLGTRAAAGVIIFFIPTIVLWLFGAVGKYNTINQNAGGFKICRCAVLSPWAGNTCKTVIATEEKTNY